MASPATRFWPTFYQGEVIHQVLNQPPTPMEERQRELGTTNDIPDYVGAMVMACLQKDPEKRPVSAAAIRKWIESKGKTASISTDKRVVWEELAESSNPRHASSSSAPPIDSVVKGDGITQAKRSKILAFGIAAAILALIAGTATFFMGGNKAGEKNGADEAKDNGEASSIIQTQKAPNTSTATSGNAGVLLTLRGHSDRVLSVAWNPDGSQLVSGSRDKSVKIWDASNGKGILALNGHADEVSCVAWSPDNARLASASSDLTVKIWDAKSGRQPLILKGHTRGVRGLAWSPNGMRLASVGLDNVMRMWNANGEVLGEAGNVPNVDFMTCVAWSRDAKRIASCSHNKAVLRWNATSTTVTCVLPKNVEPPSLYTAVGFENFLKNNYGIRCSVFLNYISGQVLLRASDGDANLAVKILTSLKAKSILVRTTPDIIGGPLTGHTGDVTSLSWSPNGKKLASGGGQDKTVRIWDADKGLELRTLTGHTDYVYSVSWSPDGTRIASGGGDHIVRIWDATSGKMIKEVEGHSDKVTSVAWSPDSKKLASGSWDKTVKVWDVAE